ncbi:unnamed protein product [Acanthoscelides obtectus]|uniref:Uncharacterized protein n=1 Tax=Acanthoscelides obtectus TaxID=200917 RepID=A0A9P0PC85_ACAOB|nr:unnamed protein product [Acanthoscelides obtectus]CAK1671675.1 hypothetical protein AOBTE_LOCUS28396 [Acanthoscelides obtectus]
MSEMILIESVRHTTGDHLLMTYYNSEGTGRVTLPMWIKESTICQRTPRVWCFVLLLLALAYFMYVKVTDKTSRRK